MLTVEKILFRVFDILRGKLLVSEIRAFVLCSVYLHYYSNTLAERLGIEAINGELRDRFSDLLNNELRKFSNSYCEAFHSAIKDNDLLRDVMPQLGIEQITNRYKNELYPVYRIISELNSLELPYEQVFDQIITMFSEQEGKAGDSFSTPHSVRKLYSNLLGDVDSVIDGACGSGGLLYDCKTRENVKIYGQDFNQNTLAIAKLRFAFTENVYLEACDSLWADHLLYLKADGVVMNPPFNQFLDQLETIEYAFYGLPPRNNANMLWIQWAIHHLSENGKGLVLTSNSSLSSTAEANIRRGLIENGCIDAIITLPENLFYHTSIATSLWILSTPRKNRTHCLLLDCSEFGQSISHRIRTFSDEDISIINQIFINWSEKGTLEQTDDSLARVVSIQEIAENNYSLIPARYLQVSGLEEYDLSNAVELRTLIESARKIDNIEGILDIKKLGIKDLSDNVDQFQIYVDALEEYQFSRPTPLYDGNKLLLARNGDNLKPSYLPYLESAEAVFLQNVYPFTVNTDKVRIDYLVQELHKKYVKLQFSKFRTGNTIPFIRINDLLSVKIIVPPSNEQQEKEVKKEKEIRFQSYAKLHGYEEQIVQMREQQRKDLGSKRHNILQYINTVKTSIDVLFEMMNLNNGVLKKSDKIPGLGFTVLERFEELQKTLDNVIFYAENITNELSFGKLEVLNAIELVKNTVNNGIINSSFIPISKIDGNSIKNNKPLIKVSKLDFQELYNNVIENAIRHGFTDIGKKYEFRYSVWIDNRKVHILFENTGEPFPEGMGTKEKYCTRGEKAGSNKNTGEGGWKVCQIAQHFGADLEIISEPEEYYTVGIKLIFDLVE